MSQHKLLHNIFGHQQKEESKSLYKSSWNLKKALEIISKRFLEFKAKICILQKYRDTQEPASSGQMVFRDYLQTKTSIEC